MLSARRYQNTPKELAIERSHHLHLLAPGVRQKLRIVWGLGYVFLPSCRTGVRSGLDWVNSQGISCSAFCYNHSGSCLHLLGTHGKGKFHGALDTFWAVVGLLYTSVCSKKPVWGFMPVSKLSKHLISCILLIVTLKTCLSAWYAEVTNYKLCQDVSSIRGTVPVLKGLEGSWYVGW